ncbi:MAG: capsule assembly Wzi family protein [Ignavibacteria bacterium]
MKKFFTVFFVTIILYTAVIKSGYSQVELVPPSNPVYEYLQRMQTLRITPDYNPANIPISRESVAGYLSLIEANSNRITSVDKKLLKDYRVEFEYELEGTIKKSSSFFKEIKNIFSDDRQKYLYAYTDSNAALFLDGIGSLSQRGSDGDSIGKHSILLGEGGFRVRGSLYNSVGYYLRASNGQKLSGDTGDVDFARNTDPRLFAQYKFQYEQRNFDTFEGYLRYRTKQNWLALTIGRNPVYQGFGFIDRLYLSNNTVPFDFLKLDLGYKAVSYSFLYGSLRGDSIGKPLESKNIATHRLDLRFGNSFRLGFFESVTIPNSPFSFTFLNPINFLTSAELNKASQPGDNNANNAIIGFDMMVIPFRKLALQGSLLVDDLEFSTLFKSNAKITNKFAFQFGALWSDAFTIPNLELKTEYTHLDPFVYTHVSNKSSYTNWSLPLGHHLEPNSDEIAVKLNYNITNRLNINILYQHQRSANGIVTDSLGRVLVNYGGNINNASGYSYSDPKFLRGNRIDRDIITANLTWQFIRQYFIELKFVQRSIKNIYQNNKKFDDKYFFATLRVDY